MSKVISMFKHKKGVLLVDHKNGTVTAAGPKKERSVEERTRAIRDLLDYLNTLNPRGE